MDAQEVIATAEVVGVRGGRATTGAGVAAGLVATIGAAVRVSRARKVRRRVKAKPPAIGGKVAICDWPKSERPREKLLERGSDALSDAELLAVLLRCGTKGRNAIELAQEHIVAFGSLRELLTAEYSRWSKKDGVGVARYAAFQAALELARRHLLEPLKVGSPLSAPNATRKFLLAQLRNLPYEVFCCLYLDARHRLIAFEELFRGTTDNAHVHVKEVMRQVLVRNACSLILAHNHPSGDTQPSKADECITRRLREALGLMDVKVLDHLIVGEDHCFSFAEHGLL